jgi:hypothetical protein
MLKQCQRTEMGQGTKLSGNYVGQGTKAESRGGVTIQPPEGPKLSASRGRAKHKG